MTNLTEEKQRLYNLGYTDLQVGRKIMETCGLTTEMINSATDNVVLSYLNSDESWLSTKLIVPTTSINESYEADNEKLDSKLYLMSNIRRVYNYNEAKVFYIATTFFKWQVGPFWLMKDFYAAGIPGMTFMPNSEYNQSYYRISYISPFPFNQQIAYEKYPSIKNNGSVASSEIYLDCLKDNTFSDCYGYIQAQFNPFAQSNAGNYSLYSAYFHTKVIPTGDVSFGVSDTGVSAGISVSLSITHQKRELHTTLNHSNIFLKSSNYNPTSNQSVTLYRIKSAQNPNLYISVNPKDNDDIYLSRRTDGNNQLFRLINSTFNYEAPGLKNQIGFYRIESQVAKTAFLSLWNNDNSNNLRLKTDYDVNGNYQNFLIHYEESQNEGTTQLYSIHTANSTFTKNLTSENDMSSNIYTNAPIVQYTYQQSSKKYQNKWIFEEASTYNPGDYELPSGDKVQSNISQSKVYALRNRDTGKYLQTSGSTTTSYALDENEHTTGNFIDSRSKAIANKAYSERTAKFHLSIAGSYSGKTTYNIISQFNQQLALDVPGGDAISGLQLMFFDRNGGNAQRYALQLDTDGSYKLLTLVSNYSMAVTQDGSIVVQKNIGLANQNWILEETIDNTSIAQDYTWYYIQNVSKGTVLEVIDGNTGNRTRIRHTTLKPDASYQQFRIEYQTDGTIFIKPRHTTRYVYQGATLTTFIGIYDLNTSDSKFHYKLIPNDDGSFKIAVGYFSYTEVYHADSGQSVTSYLGSGPSNWRLVRADTTGVSEHEKSLYLGNNNAEKIMYFSPLKSGYYHFETTGSYDTFITVDYNGSIRTFDDTGSGTNAKITNYFFQQGKSYKIKFRMWSSTQSGIVGLKYTYGAVSEDIRTYVNGQAMTIVAVICRL